MKKSLLPLAVILLSITLIMEMFERRSGRNETIDTINKMIKHSNRHVEVIDLHGECLNILMGEAIERKEDNTNHLKRG